MGIGQTKTLAKVADENAKARKRAGWGEGVYVCPEELELEELLRRVPAGDIWDIGSAYEEKLKEKGVTSAAGFRGLPDTWIRREMTVVGLRTAQELRGRPCLELELVRPDRKTLVRSRSFGKRVTSKANLREALASHGERAAEKLMAAVDRVNREHEKGTVNLVATGLPQSSTSAPEDWKMKRQNKSPRYTTRLDELPVATAR